MNVIFLTLDALTYTRLGAGGASPSPSPVMDRLSERSVQFTRMFAAGCPTMFAMPALFTSRLPLDDGGYGMGIRDRGTSFVEVLRDAGYRTAGFCTGFYQGRVYGYDRGFDDYNQFFDLGSFSKILRGLYLDYLTARRNQGVLTEADAVARLTEWLAAFIPALRQYCLEKADEASTGRVLHSPLLHDRAFESIAEFARMEERRFTRDPKGYSSRLLAWGHEESVFDILPGFSRPRGSIGQEDGVNRLLEAGGFDSRQPTLGPSGGYLTDNLMRWVGRQSRDAPWFAWAHLIDCHDLNFTSYDRTSCDGDVPGRVLEDEIAEAGTLRSRLLAERGGLVGNVHYDLAIRYADEQVGRLLNFLEERDLRRDTLVVLGSDHGGWKNGYPGRPADAGYMSFYDEIYHVPLMFSHPDLSPRKIDALSSSLDFAPTLLSLLGLPIPSDYRGEVATDGAWAGRPFVTMEHMASGPCDWTTKNLHLCLRSERHKIVCEIPPLWSDGEGALREMYDLRADPLEQENLAGTGDFPESAAGLVEAAEQRLAELKRNQFGAA